MPIAELETANIYYESIGDGPPLMFAHGAGGDAFSWWQQTASFSARYRCITFDHPGFRHSPWVNRESDPTAVYGAPLRELLDHLQIERVRFVAQGLSCSTALSTYSLRGRTRTARTGAQ